MHCTSMHSTWQQFVILKRVIYSIIWGSSFGSFNFLVHWELSDKISLKENIMYSLHMQSKNLMNSLMAAIILFQNKTNEGCRIGLSSTGRLMLKEIESLSCCNLCFKSYTLSYLVCKENFKYLMKNFSS